METDITPIKSVVKDIALKAKYPVEYIERLELWEFYSAVKLFDDYGAKEGRRIFDQVHGKRLPPRPE